MKRLRLDRLNMKLVVAIGLGVILIVTALFIVFRTNLIFDHRRNRVDEITVSEEAKERKKNPEDLNIAEKKYLIEENVNNALKDDDELQETCEEECVLNAEDFLQYVDDESISGCHGEIVVSDGMVDMTGITCSSQNTNPGGNSSGGTGGNNPSSNGGSPNNPTYPDPVEPTPSGPIAQEVKDRTKPADKLTPDEKKYIIDENVKKMLDVYDKDDKKKTQCDSKNEASGCSWSVEEFSDYADGWRVGYVVEGCTGNVLISYDADKKKFSSDTSKVTCK